MAKEVGHDCTVLEDCASSVDLELPAPLSASRQTSSIPARQTSSRFARQTSSIVTGYDMDDARYEVLLSLIEKERYERQKELFDLRQELQSLAFSSTDVLRGELQKELEDLREKVARTTAERTFLNTSTCDEAMKAATTILSEAQEAALTEPKQPLLQSAGIDTRKKEDAAPGKTCARGSPGPPAASVRMPVRSPSGKSCCSEQFAVSQPSFSFSCTVPARMASATSPSHASLSRAGSAYAPLHYASAPPPAITFSKRDEPCGSAGAQLNLRSAGEVRRSNPWMWTTR